MIVTPRPVFTLQLRIQSRIVTVLFTLVPLPPVVLIGAIPIAVRAVVVAMVRILVRHGTAGGNNG
jgi:hypothetical protein